MPPHHRISILGASGSGASTLGREVARELGVPHFDCDDYFHGPSDPPFENPRSPQERYRLVVQDMTTDASWVLSGGLAGWSPYPELHFTLVVFLWVKAKTRIARLRAREAKRFGTRIAPGGDMFAGHSSFITWAGEYDSGQAEGKNLAEHEAYLARQTCQVLRLVEPGSGPEMAQTIIDLLARPTPPSSR